MFKGGKGAALKQGVSVTRTAASLDDDRVDLKMKVCLFKNDEICIYNDGFCIKNDEFCVKTDEF